MGQNILNNPQVNRRTSVSLKATSQNATSQIATSHLTDAQVAKVVEAWKNGQLPAPLQQFFDKAMAEATTEGKAPDHAEVVRWTPKELMGHLATVLPPPVVVPSATSHTDGDGQDAPSSNRLPAAVPGLPFIQPTPLRDKARQAALSRMAYAAARWSQAQHAEQKQDDAVHDAVTKKQIQLKLRQRHDALAHALQVALNGAMAAGATVSGADLLVGGPTGSMRANAQGGQLAADEVLDPPAAAASLQEHHARGNTTAERLPPQLN